MVDIFETTFQAKKFSPAEKDTVVQTLMQDYCLERNQRDQLRSKIFTIARSGLNGSDSHGVLDWLEEADKLLLGRRECRAYFSPGHECKDAILEKLKCASVCVDICVYTISDDQLAHAVADCHQRKLNVRIITDDEKVTDRGSDIYELAARGIQTKVDDSRNYMHHKFAIFDNRDVMTGSYNWTRSAAECNQENLLFTDDPRAVEEFKGEFEKLWDLMDFLKLPGHRY